MGWATALGICAIVITGATSAWESLSPKTKSTVWTVAAVVVALWLAYRLVRRTRRARRMAANARWQAESDRHLVTADGMTGTQFENLVRRLLERDALTKVTVAGGSADRGADVVGRTADGHRVVVQCKRYALGRKVTSPEMQLFVGMAWHEHNADRPLYVTTVEYTQEAERVARKHGVYLIGRAELAEWMSGAPVFDVAVPPSRVPRPTRETSRRRGK